MDLRQIPTTADLAKMLDSMGTSLSGAYPETFHVLRWLIECSPPARDLYDRLHAQRDGEPSLIEMARLVIAVEHGEPYPEAVYTVQWLIERSATAKDLYRRLDRMARDAGFDDRDRDWAVSALQVRVELDRLLATLDDWRDAAEAIELEMEKDYAFKCLLAVCRARLLRSQGDERSRLERLRRRLQDAARRAIHHPSEPEARLNELEISLRSMTDPAAVLATVEELIRRRQAQAGDEPDLADPETS